MQAALIPIIIALVEASAKYGPQLVSSALLALNKDEISLEDIQGLKITKDPGEF